MGREGQTWGALGNLGLLPGQWQFRAGEQRTSPALPAGAEHTCPAELGAAVATAGPLSLAQGPFALRRKHFCPTGLEWALWVWG